MVSLRRYGGEGLVLLVGGLLLTFLGAHEARSSEPRKITVSGRCNRLVTPDRGSVVLSVDFRDDELKMASKRAVESYGRVRDAVKRLNLKDLDLRTVEYSVGEVREWEKGRQVMKGYRARMGLRVATSQVERLGDVLAIGSREGVQDIGGLQSFLSEEKQLQEQVACLEEAAQNARTKAEKLAASLGVKVGEPLAVVESGGFQEPPRRMTMMSMSAEATGGVPSAPAIEPGQQTLSLSVEATFALK